MKKFRQQEEEALKAKEEAQKELQKSTTQAKEK